MDHSKGIEPITALKSRSAELIKRARESGQPVIITQNGKATAVVQDVEGHDRQRKALQLLRLMAEGDQQLRAGKGVVHAEAMAHMRTRLHDEADD